MRTKELSAVNPYALSDKEALAILQFLQVRIAPEMDPAFPQGLSCIGPDDVIPFHACNVQDAVYIEMGFSCIPQIELRADQWRMAS